jgi:hypothetical protein
LYHRPGFPSTPKHLPTFPPSLTEAVDTEVIVRVTTAAGLVAGEATVDVLGCIGGALGVSVTLLDVRITSSTRCPVWFDWGSTSKSRDRPSQDHGGGCEAGRPARPQRRAGRRSRGRQVERPRRRGAEPERCHVQSGASRATNSQAAARSGSSLPCRSNRAIRLPW